VGSGKRNAGRCVNCRWSQEKENHLGMGAACPEMLLSSRKSTVMSVQRNKGLGGEGVGMYRWRNDAGAAAENRLGGCVSRGMQGQRRMGGQWALGRQLCGGHGSRVRMWVQVRTGSCSSVCFKPSAEGRDGEEVCKCLPERSPVFANGPPRRDVHSTTRMCPRVCRVCHAQVCVSGVSCVCGGGVVGWGGGCGESRPVRCRVPPVPARRAAALERKRDPGSPPMRVKTKNVRSRPTRTRRRCPAGRHQASAGSRTWRGSWVRSPVYPAQLVSRELPGASVGLSAAPQPARGVWQRQLGTRRAKNPRSVQRTGVLQTFPTAAMERQHQPKCMSRRDTRTR